MNRYIKFKHNFNFCMNFKSNESEENSIQIPAI